ncbi:MAG TPA: class I SAM-dependent methyltransferase [Gemmatimonadales bacterium]|nr:class I SAM-dependent methyltransferase [Gemmatimonadales bacterium]
MTPHAVNVDPAGGRGHVTAERSRAEEARIRAAYARRGGAWRYDWGNPAYVFAMHDLERRVLRALRRSGSWPLAGRRILDVGCGTGYWVQRLIAWGAQPDDVAGIDLLRDRVRKASRLSPSPVALSCGSALALPYRGATFDLVLQFMVFSSILDPEVRASVADEMVRVLAPGRGAILWYDFALPNPRNRDVRPVRAGEIRRLFPGCTVELRRITLALPLTRLLAPLSWTLCALLNLVPPLRTHYLGVITKR